MRQLRVKDLPLAALLVANGHPYRIEPTDTRVCFFVFESNDQTEQLRRSFGNGTAMVNALVFSQALRGLKNELHQV